MLPFVITPDTLDRNKFELSNFQIDFYVAIQQSITGNIVNSPTMCNTGICCDRKFEMNEKNVGRHLMERAYKSRNELYFSCTSARSTNSQ